MTLFEIRSAAQMALATVREHKMRSLLTVLGVIIGTGTVIAVGSIITGVNGVITDLTQSFGPDTIFAFQFNIGFRGTISAEEWKRKPLTWEQSREVAERCPSVAHVSPYLFSPNTFGRGGWVDRAKYGSKDLYNIEFAGTEEGYVEGGSNKMLWGRFFTDEENRRHRPVAVIGEHVYKTLFQGADPVGKWIEVDGHQLEVVGVIGQALGFPGQEDRRVLLPFFTMRKMFPSAKQMMFVIIAQTGLADRAMDELESRFPADAEDSGRQARRFLALDRQPDAGGFPPYHLHGGDRDGGDELDRPAGGRNRRDEHHAGLGNGAYARDRNPQGGGGA